MKKSIKKQQKMLKASYGSDKTPLIIGETELPCYVLEDGTRVLSGRGMQKALGASASASGTWLKRTVNSSSLAPFIEPGVLDKLNNPIEFERQDAGGSQSKTYGYEATLLIDICDSILQANKTRAVNENILAAAEIIIRSVAKVGIIALVDEATGYQEVREKDALQKFLSKFLNEEQAKWVKTFPDEFFEMVFKFKGLTWTTANKGKKPQWIGHFINNYVYSRLAPQVLTELRKLNPKNEDGRRKGKHTQWIDMDYGHPKLLEHLNLLIAFAIAAGYNEGNWKRMIERARPQFKDGSAALQIPFTDID